MPLLFASRMKAANDYLISTVADLLSQHGFLVVVKEDGVSKSCVSQMGGSPLANGETKLSDRDIPGRVAFPKSLEDVPDDGFRKLILEAQVLGASEETDLKKFVSTIGRLCRFIR